MARQKGIIKVKGTIGDLTFYKSGDGYLLREKGGIDGKRIATDPAFQRTRENGSEFGRAGKSGKVLRKAFRPLIQMGSDSRMVSRLVRSMMRVIKTDTSNPRGERNLMNGDLSILNGFDFNIKGKLGTTFFASFDVNMDRASGEMSIDIAPFVPIEMISIPEGASHYKIMSGAAAIDFNEEVYEMVHTATAEQPLDGVLTSALNHNHELTAGSELPLFLVLGIAFFQEVNGEMYVLRNGAFNPLSIVGIENAV